MTWRPITEEAPAPGSQVLVSTDTGFVAIMRRYRHRNVLRWHFGSRQIKCTGDAVGVPTHYMPVPEPALDALTIEGVLA